jgi:septal ring factor EnvC (AmiA/AmiB activator)
VITFQATNGLEASHHANNGIASKDASFDQVALQETWKKMADLELTIASQKEEIARSKEALARINRDYAEVSHTLLNFHHASRHCLAHH